MNDSDRVDLPGRTFRFAVRVVKLCRVLDETRGTSRTLANQLLRSATSIGANVEESQGGLSRKDFVFKLSLALKEARETHYWLRLLKEADVISADRLEDLIDESNQLVAILTTIVKNTRAQ